MSPSLPGQMRALMLEAHRDCAMMTPGVAKSNDFARDRKFIAQATPDVLLAELPRVGKALDSYLAKGCESEFSLETVSPHLPPRLFKYWVRGVQGCEPESVRALRQVCSLFAKLDTGVVPGRDEAINAFIERNDAVGRVQLDPTTVRLMREIAYFVLQDLDPRDIIPRHGPGAVAERLKPWEKFGFKRVYRQADIYYPSDEYYFSSLDDFLSSYETWNPTYVDEGISRLCCVPKDFRGPRLIASEPSELMWLQQGQARQLMQHLERSRFTSGGIFFTDSSVNRDLARRASEDESMITLDLKDASDWVSLKLVQACLPTRFSEPYCATRSSRCDTPLGSIALNMFATMGSALCFPIESLMFFCCLAAAAMPRVGSFGRELMFATRRFSVYGDDLIVDRALYPRARLFLESIGLKINDSKTCVGSHFRESCGGDYFNGCDVTPVRLKSLPTKSNPLSLPAATDSINYLEARGLHCTASKLSELTENAFGPVMRTCHNDTCCIRVQSPLVAAEYNARLRDRFNRDLQRREYLAPYASPVFYRAQISDRCLLLGSLTYSLQVDDRGWPVPRRSRLSTRWMGI